MKWECEKCGSCCELFSEFVFGEKCKHLVDSSCSRYLERPMICRTGLARIVAERTNIYKGADIEEYLISRCKLIKHLKKWKEETQDCPSAQKLILQAIINAKF